jgi:integrase
MQRGDKGHFEAVPYTDAAAYWAALQAAPESIGRLALAFTILTAARSGETRGATWGEIDLQAGLWSIPGERMKAGKPHVVPLSAPALAILERMQAARAHAGAAALVFPGAGGRPLSDMTMGKAHKLLAPGTTVHGWRSTFRDWAGETTGFPPDLCEAALAHAFGSKVQRAYQRGSMLDRRRELMDAWAAYLAPPAACNVTPIGEARRSVRSV